MKDLKELWREQQVRAKLKAEGLDPTEIWQVNMSSDDAIVNWQGNFYDDWWNIWLGYHGGEEKGCFRFVPVNIPKDARIISARLKFVSWATPDITKVKLKIYGIAEGNTETFFSDPFGRPHTSAAVDWDPETWPGHEYIPGTPPGEGDWVETPNIGDIVAEIKSMTEWSPGNPMGFFIENDGGSGDAEIYTYDFGPLFGPKLEVAWTLPPPLKGTIAVHAKVAGII